MSNGPDMGTGYGVQTGEVVPRIKAAGHDIAVASNYGHHGFIREWGDGIPVYPSSSDQACNDVIKAHAANFEADWTISLYDVWTMRRPMWPERVASWVPIDHQPVPPEVAAWCRQVTPIAMSRFGQRMLTAQGIESTYIPHSVNTAVFQPTESDVRASLQIPDDAFVVLIAAANKGVSPPRKAWGEMFDALGHFLRQHDDAYAYIHTDSNQAPPSGVDLGVLARQTGIPLERVRWSDPYRLILGHYTPALLARLYSMSDVLLATSMGEGFGIPVIEAQACGLPVIVSDFTAQPELCGAGWLVKGQPWHDPLQGSASFFTPYVGSIVARLEEAYAARGDNGLRERAVAFAAQYDSDLVFERYWVPFLAELQASLEPAPLNRAERRRRAKGKAA